MKLGEKIKLLRTEKNLTQPELADASGIEQSYLSKVENEKGSPSFDIINRIANALGSNAEELIGSLDSVYVQERLAHLPEIAAQVTEIRIKHEATMKRRFILAAASIVFGIAFVLTGQSKLFFPESVYNYESKGVIFAGEVIEQFSSRRSTGENVEEWSQRTRLNMSRMDTNYVVVDRYHGEKYITKVSNGRRLFTLVNSTQRKHPMNMVFIIIGMMLLVSGGLGFAYMKKFHSK